VLGLPDVTAFQIDACALICFGDKSKEAEVETNANDIYL
jgi:hypothetical protein